MRFEGGWVKTYRVLLTPKYLKKFDGYTRCILNDLVMMANLQDGEELMRGSKLCKVLRGQVLTSDVELSRATSFSRAVIRKRLDILEFSQTISIKRDKLGTIITICNYEEYQGSKTTEQPQRNNSATTGEQLSDNSATCIKELKNLKNEKKGRNRASIEAALSAQEITIATKWLEYSKREMPWKSEDPKWNIEEWAHALVELKKKTDLNDEGLERVLEFVSNDHFWAKNAVSPKMLLAKSKSNGQRKIDNILVNLRTKADRNNLKLATWLEEEKNKAPDPSIPEGHLF